MVGGFLLSLGFCLATLAPTVDILVVTLGFIGGKSLKNYSISVTVLDSLSRSLCDIIITISGLVILEKRGHTQGRIF